MTTKQITLIKKLARQAEKAANLVEHNRFLIETYLSFDEALDGKVKSYTSSRDLFRKLGI
ncbi:MAG: hypothetical protein V4697_02995 [Patescibacteria group bacterium]